MGEKGVVICVQLSPKSIQGDSESRVVVSVKNRFVSHGDLSEKSAIDIPNAPN
jgi:hypothetical protein